MSRFRLLLATVVAISLVLLTGLWSGRAPLSAKASQGLSIPQVGNEGDISSTWFCTAAAAPIEPATHHKLAISNTGSKKSEVRITAYGEEGTVGSKVVEVAAGVSAMLDLDVTFSAPGLSAMIESPSGGIAVTHWVVSAKVGDSGPCQKESSPNWYFPSQTTLAGTTSRLYLFNPFSADAGVDISAAIVDGIRAPREWAGIVVPAGTTKVVELGEFAQRRDQFSVTVTSRSGRIFAETVQTFGSVALPPSPSVTGLRLSRPVAAPRSAWTFAGGFKDVGAAESLVVQNPDSKSVTVEVQVVPYGSAEMAPEPFELTVPPRRYAILDLTEEGRVPDVGFHAITVESPADRPVIVQRMIRLSAPPAETEEGVLGRPNLPIGIASDTGATGATSRWTVPGVLVGEGNAPLLFVHNPGKKRVSVDISFRGPDGKPVMLASGQEIGATDGFALSLMTDVPSETGLRVYDVKASGPVVVEQLLTIGSTPDFAVMPALPVGDR